MELESSLCDYSDAYILVTGNINVTGGNANTKVAFKNCAPFTECKIEINEAFADKIQNINIEMLIYILIDSLWKFKRDELNVNNINTALTDDNVPSFKYQVSIIGNTVADRTKCKKDDLKLAVPLKYFSNFWSSLEMPLINCKIQLSLIWYRNCVTIVGNGNAAIFTITDTKLYVQIVTLKIEKNTKLSKLLNEGFKSSVYWNHYKIFLRDYCENHNIRERLDASFQGVSKLFVLAYQRGNNYLNEEAFNQ